MAGWKSVLRYLNRLDFTRHGREVVSTFEVSYPPKAARTGTTTTPTTNRVGEPTSTRTWSRGVETLFLNLPSTGFRQPSGRGA